MSLTLNQLQPPKILNLKEQDLLARLLAKKNIRIHHGEYTTASYDVINCVLCLPLWEDKGKDVYDLLVGHEVGHALFTPVDGITRYQAEMPNLPFDVLNIVEDIRIEKMIQREYPGLGYSFRKGYVKLLADDFFGINNMNLGKLNFTDRLNVHGKIGNLVKVPMSQKELAIFQRCANAETFDDVLAICRDILQMIKAKKSKKAPEPPESASSGKSQSGSKPEQSKNKTGDSDESNSPEESKSKNIEADESDSNSNSSDNSKASSTTQSQSANDSKTEIEQELKSLTNTAFQENVNKLAYISKPDSQNMTTGVEYFLEPTKADVMKLVTGYKEIMQNRASRYPEHYKYLTTKSPGAENHYKLVTARSKKYVNELVTEFTLKRAAFEYSRAKVSNTGVLNCNQLHKYRIDDDIFKSVSILATDKNHGMMMFIDYSSSMGSVLCAMLEHVLNVVSFCRALNIPFEVYGFTNPYNGYDQKNNTNAAPGEIELKYVSLFQLFSSEMSQSEYNLAVKEYCIQMYLTNRHCVETVQNEAYSGKGPDYMPSKVMSSKQESLSGTPLLETIVAAHTLVKTFRSKHVVQKMNVIVISDGEGNQLNLKNVDNCRLRHLSGMLNGRQVTTKRLNPLSGRPSSNYSVAFSDTYSALIENLRITTKSNVLGFYIPSSSSREVQNIIHKMVSSSGGTTLADVSNNWTSYEQRHETYLKTNCFSMKNVFGFNEYFILPSSNSGRLEADDANFSEIDDSKRGKKANKITADMSVSKLTTKLTNSFTSFNKDKNSNRVLLNKFIGAIA